MDNMNERQKAFEKKFAHDAEMLFKAEARRNKMLADWVAEKLGLSGDEAAGYGTKLIAADMKEAGDDDVVEKIMSDAAEKGVTLDQAKVKEKSAELLGLAKAELADGE